jgi:hypothetical protein
MVAALALTSLYIHLVRLDRIEAALILSSLEEYSYELD